MSPSVPGTSITPALRRRLGLTEQAAVAAADQVCRRLRLPTVRAVLDEALAVAGKEQLSYLGLLAELRLAECDDRDRRSSICRVKAAGFPGDNGSGISISTRIRTSTPPPSTPSPPETGSPKEHLSASSAIPGPVNPTCSSGSAPRRPRRATGSNTPATRLVNELVEAADEKVLAKTIARYGRVDLLCIDELLS
ncbi:hypothetical protein ABH924_001104 [Arthrobacter sp. GAS37]